MYTCGRMVQGPPLTQRGLFRGVACRVQAYISSGDCNLAVNTPAGELKRNMICLPLPSPPLLGPFTNLYSLPNIEGFTCISKFQTCMLKSGTKSRHYFVDVKDLNLYSW